MIFYKNGKAEKLNKSIKIINYIYIIYSYKHDAIHNLAIDISAKSGSFHRGKIADYTESSLDDVGAFNHSTPVLRFSDLYIKAIVCPSYFLSDTYDAGKLSTK